MEHSLPDHILRALWILSPLRLTFQENICVQAITLGRWVLVFCQIGISNHYSFPSSYLADRDSLTAHRTWTSVSKTKHLSKFRKMQSYLSDIIPPPYYLEITDMDFWWAYNITYHLSLKTSQASLYLTCFPHQSKSSSWWEERKILSKSIGWNRIGCYKGIHISLMTSGMCSLKGHFGMKVH